MTDEDIDDIEIVDDEPEVSEPVEKAAKPEKASDDPLISEDALEGADNLKRQVEELRKQRAAEEAARKAAEARALAREQEAQGYKTQADSAQTLAVEQAISGAKAEVARLKEQARIAFEEGDYRKGLDLQEKMAEGVALISRIQEHKAQLSQRPAAPQQNPQQGLTPRQRNWIEAHPEVMSNQALAKKVEASHFAAISNGLEQDSDAYFEFIEQQTGYRTAAEPVKKTTTPSAPVPSAPPSRGASLPKRTGDAKRTIPARYAQAARDMGIPLKDYIKAHDEAVRRGDMESLF